MPGTRGYIPLMLAAENGHLGTIKLLVNNGGNLLRRDVVSGYFPLHFAAKGNRVDLVKFILQNGGNVFDETGDGKTVLHLATHLISSGQFLCRGRW